MAAKRLAELSRGDRGLCKERSDRGPDECPDVPQCSGQSILRGMRATTGAMAFASQLLHRITPRNVHIRQMNVLHTAQGYPSDARSSFPQERQIIASRSVSCFAIIKSY